MKNNGMLRKGWCKTPQAETKSKVMKWSPKAFYGKMEQGKQAPDLCGACSGHEDVNDLDCVIFGCYVCERNAAWNSRSKVAADWRVAFIYRQYTKNLKERQKE